MAITTYSELKTAVANWLHRDDLTALVPDFIALGEAKIYRDLRISAMETALSGTISSGGVALPSGYLELKSAYIDGSPTQRLQRKDAGWLYTAYPDRSSSGKPVYIAREASGFIFGPYPDSAYTIKGVYYKRLDALSDSNTTNWFIENAVDLLMAAALVEGSDYASDDAGMAKWTARYTQMVLEIQAKDDAEQFSGSTLSVGRS